MQKYHLTIAVCCHAKTPYFQEMLDSFLASGVDWPKTEMLICDDGSPEGGDGDTARRYARRKNLPFPIRVIRHEEHWHQGPSRQQLVQTAKGKYILFFDSDDVFVPFDVKGDLSFLDQHPEYCGSYGKKQFFDGETGLLPRGGGGDFSALELLIAAPMVMAAMIVRREDLLRDWGFVLPDDKKLPDGCAEDICMWLSCGIRKPFHFVENLRALYRVHPGQTTWDGLEKYRRCYRILRDHLYQISADLRTSLHNSQTFQMPVDRRYELVALCGAELADAKDFGMGHRLLDVAASVLPDDYGVREMRVRLYQRENKFQEAFREIFLMLAEHPHSGYIRSIASQLAEEISGKLQYDTAPFFRVHAREKQQYFDVPEHLKPLVKRTLENAKRYAGEQKH